MAVFFLSYKKNNPVPDGSPPLAYKKKKQQHLKTTKLTKTNQDLIARM